MLTDAKYEDYNKSDDGDVIIQSKYKGDTSSLFSSQSIVKSDDESCMRQYKLRKVKKIVAKCRSRKIKFDKYFVNLSYHLTQGEDSLSMAELEKLRVECNEALGSDYCSTESSSSNSSAEKKKTQRKKEKLSYLISTTSTDSVSGCEGGIFTSPILAPQSYGIKPIYRPQPFPTYQTQFGISGPISRTFPLFATDSSSLASFATTFGSQHVNLDFGQPSLSSTPSPQSTPYPSPSVTPDETPLFSNSGIPKEEVCK